MGPAASHIASPFCSMIHHAVHRKNRRSIEILADALVHWLCAIVERYGQTNCLAIPIKARFLCRIAEMAVDVLISSFAWAFSSEAFVSLITCYLHSILVFPWTGLADARMSNGVRLVR